MEPSRKIVQNARLLCLVGIVFLAFVTRTIAPNTTANPMILGALAFLAVGDVGVVYFARRTMIARAEKLLAALPEDPKTLARWRTGYFVVYTMSGSIALYGVILHVLGVTFFRALPFFIAGFALTLVLGPRRPAESR